VQLLAIQNVTDPYRFALPHFDSFAHSFIIYDNYMLFDE
jgi:hypothetical protein